MMEIELSASSQYVSAKQYCYVQERELKKIGEQILFFSFHYETDCYVEFGSKVGNSTPAFSLEFSSYDKSGRIRIEVDMEIDDAKKRMHRCCFYVYSELGLVQRFGEHLIQLSCEKLLDSICLNG